ncbi:unnamed protein product [Orchesella dallaii]|uniref:Uncharacterized protein n=1 Tax=Orchesella dallaii TaxID=48710 RepID=A0ABP1R2W6_9HEXA
MAFNPCCCMTSRTGGIIIGVLGIIGAILGLLTVAYKHASIAQVQSIEDPDSKNQMEQEIRKQYPGSESTGSEEFYSFVNMLLIYMLVTSSINLIIASLLIHGIRKERPALIIVYLIANSALFVLSLVIMIANKAVFAMIGNVFGLMSYCLNLYFLFVVYVAYVETRNGVLERHNPAAAYEE